MKFLNLILPKCEAAAFWHSTTSFFFSFAQLFSNNNEIFIISFPVHFLVRDKWDFFKVVLFWLVLTFIVPQLFYFSSARQLWKPACIRVQTAFWSFYFSVVANNLFYCPGNYDLLY